MAGCWGREQDQGPGATWREVEEPCPTGREVGEPCPTGREVGEPCPTGREVGEPCPTGSMSGRGGGAGGGARGAASCSVGLGRQPAFIWGAGRISQKMLEINFNHTYCV